MIERAKKASERLNKAYSITIATLLLALGFSAIVYITSMTLEIINPRASEGIITTSGLYGLLSIVTIILAAGVGALISIAYVVYIIDKLRSSEGEAVFEEGM
ncbi:MAG TPA: hypothetical protein VNL13_06165 [Sulfolobales archaeon]|nr:hypothetical protein [Sulfolobales archaeon]